MAEIRFVKVERWHVDYVAEHMRDQDVEEARALYDLSPRQALDYSLASYGDHWTALFNGEPAAIFGVVPGTVLGTVGMLWMLGTPRLLRHSKLFAKSAKRVVDEMLERYDVLVNEAYANNTVTIRWLTWLGAKLYYNGDRVRFEICAE